MKREDYVWIQEHAIPDPTEVDEKTVPLITTYLGGKIPGRVLLLFLIRLDKGIVDRYAYIHILTPVNKGEPERYHSLFEFVDPMHKRSGERVPDRGTSGPWSGGVSGTGSRPTRQAKQSNDEKCPTRPTVYNVSQILRSAHIVTTREHTQHNGHYYANPYVDWDAYTKLY